MSEEKNIIEELRVVLFSLVEMEENRRKLLENSGMKNEGILDSYLLQSYIKEDALIRSWEGLMIEIEENGEISKSSMENINEALGLYLDKDVSGEEVGKVVNLGTIKTPAAKAMRDYKKVEDTALARSLDYENFKRISVKQEIADEIDKIIKLKEEIDLINKKRKELSSSSFYDKVKDSKEEPSEGRGV